MSVLYVTQQDAVLRKEDERLKVTLKGETLLDLPMIKVSQVVLLGRVTVTPHTVASLMERTVDVCYLSEHGRYVGKIEPAFSKNVLLRRAQYAAAFDRFQASHAMSLFDLNCKYADVIPSREVQDYLRGLPAPADAARD